jgi:peptidoglycan/LPS O-acetylase OafA/YrhL
LAQNPKVKYLKELKNKLFADVTTIPAIVQDDYYVALNGLRGIAILMVLLYHFGANYYLWPFHIFIDGDFGVYIFFIISGFLITTLLLKEKVKYGIISLKHFYSKRALRIIPVAYLFLLVMVVLTYFYHFRITGSNFLSSFLFYKNFPYQSDAYTGHFWTLAAEVQFYLIFPFLLTLNINRYLVTVLTLVILVPLISVLGYYNAGLLNSGSALRTTIQIIMYSFWKGPFIILIGSLAALLLFKEIISIKKKNDNYFLSFILFVTAIVISSQTFLLYFKYLSECFAFILIAWVVLLSLKGNDLLSAILGHPVVVRIGIIAYSLYVWQQLFIGNRLWQPWMKMFHGYPIWALLLIKLAYVFLIAFFSYYFFERKFLKLKSRIKV